MRKTIWEQIPDQIKKGFTENDVKRLRRIWAQMRRRCNDPKSHAYPRYGGKGIKVDPQWNESCVPFCIWALTHGYKDGLSIDRIDSERGNYGPEECRWATNYVQANNKSVNTRYQDKESLVGRVFDHLEVLAHWGTDRKCMSLLRVKCLLCGEEKTVREAWLLEGRVKSCSCLQPKLREEYKKSMIGKRFGHWVVVDWAYKNQSNYYYVRCDCGTLRIMRGSLLTFGTTRSCGKCHIEERIAKSQKTRRIKSAMAKQYLALISGPEKPKLRSIPADPSSDFESTKQTVSPVIVQSGRVEDVSRAISAAILANEVRHA